MTRSRHRHPARDHIMGEIPARPAANKAQAWARWEKPSRRWIRPRSECGFGRRDGGGGGQPEHRRASWSTLWRVQTGARLNTAQEHGSVPLRGLRPVLINRPCWCRQSSQCTAPGHEGPQNQPPAWLHQVGRPHAHPQQQPRRIGQGRGG